METISIIALKDGLNYGSVESVKAGFQRLELWDNDGDVLLGASGGRCISAECPDCIYNMNPQVVALGDNPGDVGSCPSTSCSAGELYIPDTIWEDPNPQVQCEPPCNMVLPPYPLSSTATYIWPALTTTLWSSSNNVLYTKATTI